MRWMVLALLPVLAAPAVLAADRAVPLKPDIAAVVGGQPISTFDVDNRLTFIIVSSGLPNTPDTVARLKPQVVRALVDEVLQLQETEKYSITITDGELTQTIAGIEQGRGLRPGAIFALLDQHRIPHETFTRQIRAQLAWRKLVIKKIRPGVRVSDEEIQLAALSPSAGAPQELKIAVLTLPVDKPAQAAAVENTARKLAKDLRDGASFEEVSRQLNRSGSGDGAAFWVRPEQLDPGLARVLSSARPGTITEPIRGANGIVVVKVYDTRSARQEPATNAEVRLKEIALALKSSDTPEDAHTLLTIARDVAKHPGNCEETGVAGIEDLDAVSIRVSSHRKQLSELPDGIRGIVDRLSVGAVSEPFATDGGLLLYMLCERKEQPKSDAEQDQLRAQIYQQKIELEAQKYLRNLRRDTYIEIRG